MNPKKYNVGNQDYKAGFREGRDQVVTRLLEIALTLPMDDVGKKIRKLANQICEEFPADYSTPPVRIRQD